MGIPHSFKYRDQRPGNGLACSIAVMSLLRGLPLFVLGRPRTPLRVLCVMAFDALHVMIRGRRLPRDRIIALGALLDLGASANRFFDKKKFCRHEYRVARQQLKTLGVHVSLRDYLNRLRYLEKQRPAIGGSAERHETVRKYREAVVKLSLEMAASVTFSQDDTMVGFGFEHTNDFFGDGLAVLFRIVMQCQIIDDVLDYRKDVTTGLAGFVTVPASRLLALKLTRGASVKYSQVDRSGPFPFTVLLFWISRAAILVTTIAGWKRQPEDILRARKCRRAATTNHRSVVVIAKTGVSAVVDALMIRTYDS